MNNMSIKNKNKYILKIIAIVTAIMLTLTACGSAEASTQSDGAKTEAVSQTDQTAASKYEIFTERDLSGEYDESQAVQITLDGTTASSTSGNVSISGSAITITEEGVYVVSGTLSDGMIVVDADDAAKIQIVLKNAEITSSTSAALYVKSADKVFVTTAAGTTNVLANGGTFTAIDENNIDGAVFAKDDITFNGSGSLTVTSPAGHGIVGKDDVKIAGGTISITAAKHGIQANDSARFAEADITIEADTDGVHVSDNSDAEEGTESDSYFYMADGNLTISAGDDGIHADAEALIEGGTITVSNSYEGIEALSINVSGGDIKVNASDDGLNAAGGNTSGTTGNTFGDDDWAGGRGGFPGGGGFSDGGSEGSIIISGGNIYVKAGGDGIDSNGSLLISGGFTVICGPTQGDTSVLDYNSTGEITGGTFIGTGSSGMAQNFSNVENQGLIVINTGGQPSNSTVTLKDSSGNIVAETTPELDYAVIYISTPDVQQGNTYTLTAGNHNETIDLTESIYGSLSGGMRGGMQNGGKPGFNSGDLQGSMPDNGEAGENGSEWGGPWQAEDGMQNGRGGHGHRGMHGGKSGNDSDADTGASQSLDSEGNAA